MSRKVVRFSIPLSSADLYHIDVPSGSLILGITMHNNKPVMCVSAEETEELETRHFILRDSQEYVDGQEYIATLQTPDREWRFMYEVTPAA